MYLELEHEAQRNLRLKRSWSLQNKTERFHFSFSALLRETVHVAGTRGIRLQYELADFQSENLDSKHDIEASFEFVLTETGAISSGDAPTGYMADVAEDIRSAWVTPEVGVAGLCWTTQPGIHSKLEKPMRSFEALIEHRITEVKERSLLIESRSDVSLKLEAGTRMGPLHGSSRQMTTLVRQKGPIKMQRETKVILHDLGQQRPSPVTILSVLENSESG